MKEKQDSGHSFKDYFKRATTQIVVLRLLSEKPMYGYQMTQEMEKRSKSRYTKAILYPVIYKLQSLGLIEEVDKKISDKNRVQNYYGITEAGRKHLEEIWAEYTEMVQVLQEIMDYHEEEQLNNED